ncbi:hypothetical protein Ddye_013265 [Dipteronia dyeriana]|uniref:PGG domain-containing protein n=1 Tax=Dipteronia dyeriana TaxID=168575 RepID=A0AAE0CJG4_9ROSI|nr:hypothetical protein Ddye_013265 [Dipteronia dyeriana]
MVTSNNSSGSPKLLDAIKNDDIKAWQSDGEMVMALLNLRVDVVRPLYYEKDGDFFMIPLQFVVVYDHVDMILLLLSACLDSIRELNLEKQMVFHLAAKYCSLDAFRILVGEAKRLHKVYMLDEEDYYGNKALHIALYFKQLRIVKMCLLDQLSSTTGGHDFLIHVNAKNMNDETALDLYDKILGPDYETWKNEILFHQAIKRELYLTNDPSADHHHPSTSTIPSWWTLETKNMLLVVLAIFITLAFTLTCTLTTFFLKEYMFAIDLEFELKDLLCAKLLHIFYIMSFITVLPTTSTCILFVLLYSFPCGTIMLLDEFVTSIVYLLCTYFFMPKFCQNWLLLSRF